jgi:hypothetical protein
MQVRVAYRPAQQIVRPTFSASNLRTVVSSKQRHQRHPSLSGFLLSHPRGALHLEFPAFPALAAALLKFFVIGSELLHNTLYGPRAFRSDKTRQKHRYRKQEATSRGHGD